jgi:hypothetical protein
MHLETTFEFFKVKSHLIACDSVVVATFEQMCIFKLNYGRSIVVKLKYVKWVEEILELNHGILNIIVFFCVILCMVH